MSRSSLFKLSTLCASLFLLTNLNIAFAQNPAERIQLQMLLRQIDLMQTTIKAQSAHRDTRSRYYFDYQRLNADLSRIKGGINDYLQPKRAQPRDPVELTGHYRQEARKIPGKGECNEFIC